MVTDEYRRSALRVRYSVLKHELSEAEQREDDRFQEIERELRAMEAAADAVQESEGRSGPD